MEKLNETYTLVLNDHLFVIHINIKNNTLCSFISIYWTTLVFIEYYSEVLKSL